MGGPLSTLIAEIYMSHMEDKLISPIPDNLLYYRRYVDDIVGVWNCPMHGLQQFLQEIKQFHPSMVFTLEIGGTSITFLKLTLNLVTKYPQESHLYRYLNT